MDSRTTRELNELRHSPSSVVRNMRNQFFACYSADLSTRMLTILCHHALQELQDEAMRAEVRRFYKWLMILIVAEATLQQRRAGG